MCSTTLHHCCCLRARASTPGAQRSIRRARLRPSGGRLVKAAHRQRGPTMNRKNQSKSVPFAPRTVSPGAGAMIRGHRPRPILRQYCFSVINRDTNLFKKQRSRTYDIHLRFARGWRPASHNIPFHSRSSEQDGCLINSGEPKHAQYGHSNYEFNKIKTRQNIRRPQRSRGRWSDLTGALYAVSSAQQHLHMDIKHARCACIVRCAERDQLLTTWFANRSIQ